MIKISVNYLNKNLQFSVINLKQNTSKNKKPSPKASCIIDESLLSSVVKTSWALLTDQVIFGFVFFVLCSSTKYVHIVNCMGLSF